MADIYRLLIEWTDGPGLLWSKNGAGSSFILIIRKENKEQQKRHPRP